MKVRAAPRLALRATRVLFAGCGSSDRQQVRSKVEQFAVAVAHKDAKTICNDVFAPSLVKRLAGARISCVHGLEIFFSALRNPTLQSVPSRSTGRGPPR